ncbi:MAG: peptidoglycan D,D-transpeptidase FtsI family protein [Brevinematia bacterium]
MRRRIFIVFYIFLAMILVVISRIVYLSFSNVVYTDSSKFTGNRGEILDRNGNILAVSYKTFSLGVDVSQLSDIEMRQIADMVSDYFGIRYNDVLRKLERGSRFVWLIRKIPESGVDGVVKITNAFDKGNIKRSLKVVEEYVRRYPLGEKASTVVGSVNIDNEGISGFEYSFNDVLSERSGKRGKVILTIDKYIQEITYLELLKSVKEFEADLGFAVFATKEGEILSMVDYPSFDPNNLSMIPFSSRTVSYIIEPGSVMKLASMAFALTFFKNIENSYYDCGGIIRIYDHTIREKAHGKVSLRDIVAYSCNVGMLKVIENFDNSSFYFFLRSFGFGDKTLIGLPGEEAGIFRHFSEWSGISKYMVGIGQEIGVTGIQLLKMGLIIANKGLNVSPKLVKEIELQEGGKKYIRYSEDIRVISSYVSEKILDYMRSSVEYGTGKLADVGLVRVAGKTGTGQIYNTSGGYYRDSYNSVFLGIAPYGSPRIVGVVVLVNPKKLKQGGLSAAPTFRNILEKIISYNPNIIQTQ